MSSSNGSSWQEEGWKSEEERRKAYELARQQMPKEELIRLYSTEEEMFPLEPLIEELEAMDRKRAGKEE